jgi:CPA2 family monovalent cation:H+ antiporter-2
MRSLEFLGDFLIVLAAAVVVLFASRPLKLPSVIGFLVTGMLIGPSGFNFITNREQIEIFAELGVVMLLFYIGLEFSLSQLRTIWRPLLVGGGLQVALTTLAVVLLLSFTDFSVNERIVLGFITALSSTAILMKLLIDRGQVDSPHGRVSLAISLFQDISIVPMILLIPVLAGEGKTSFLEFLSRFGFGVLLVILVYITARRLMPGVLHAIAQTRLREAFLMGSLLICLLMAFITFSFGFSYALGAFIAGLIISESEYSHEVVAEIVSFRDLFTSLFFISIGMLFDIDFVLSRPVSLLGISIALFLLKATIIAGVVVFVRYSIRTAIISAVGLANIGEFSFVLAQVGLTAGILNQELFQYFLSASVLTMIASIPLLAGAPGLADRTQHLLPARWGQLDRQELAKPLEDHVIIVGYGVNGQNLARVLKETGIPYIILEADGQKVRDLQKEGHRAAFGDATRKEILSHCHIEKARLIVLAISDPQATRTAVRLARSLNPRLHIIVRTRHLTEIDELVSLGANQVIPEEFETSIEIFTRVLEHYHIPRNVINAQIQIVRDENYSMLRGLPPMAGGLDRVAQLLAAGTTDTLLVMESSIAANRSLGDLRIQEKAGASVIAVVRNEQPFITPPDDFVVQAGDILVLVGNHATMDKAFEYLSQRNTPSSE